ncbi:hypothetical protein EV715DRAFT_297901 [Schizophyllum commune]
MPRRAPLSAWPSPRIRRAFGRGGYQGLLRTPRKKNPTQYFPTIAVFLPPAAAVCGDDDGLVLSYQPAIEQTAAVLTAAFDLYMALRLIAARLAIPTALDDLRVLRSPAKLPVLVYDGYYDRRSMRLSNRRRHARAPSNELCRNTVLEVPLGSSRDGPSNSYPFDDPLKRRASPLEAANETPHRNLNVKHISWDYQNYRDFDQLELTRISPSERLLSDGTRSISTSAYSGFLAYSPKLELGMSERVCDWVDPWSRTEKVFGRREGLLS